MVLNSFSYRFRRHLAKNRSSIPFLSSDAFREACGLSYVEKLHSSEVLADICENFEIPIIFVKTDSAKEFYRCVIEGGFQVGTVVYGDSDLDLDISCIPFQHIVRKAFVQNLNLKHSQLEPLPLGIENLSRFYNGRPELFGEKYVRKNKINAVLVGPFAPTHPDRVELEVLEDSKYIKNLRNRMIPDVYAEFSSGFRFIACPRGNGFDTHRFWEALYRGSIPIVIESFWSQYFLDIGIPLIVVKSWTKEQIIAAITESKVSNFDPRQLPMLWIEYWMDKFMKPNSFSLGIN